jgi:hypothetical protein
MSKFEQDEVNSFSPELAEVFSQPPSASSPEAELTMWSVNEAPEI